MCPDPARRTTAALRESRPPTHAAVPAARSLRDPSGAPAVTVPSLPVPEVFTALDSCPRGLTPAEAAARQARYGPDELPDASRGHGWRRLVTHSAPASVSPRSTPPSVRPSPCRRRCRTLTGCSSVISCSWRPETRYLPTGRGT
ncbi:cation-transporting P-type ATPase [Streptomyces sp. NPDC088560]|uniref:cation-transporting P-type ATPase n=1 Tax=Streptomyces sp. NPDC088560 TaxID=3365868 RepID=UPI0037F2D753